jgi:hypothetical protein
MARRRKKRDNRPSAENYHSDDPRQQSLPIVEVPAAAPQVALPHEPVGELATNDAPEPTTTEPDRIRLHSADGSEVELLSRVRLHNLVRLRGRIYELRAVDQLDGKWLRIYREVVPHEIRIVATGG